MCPPTDAGKQAAEVAYRMANILSHKGRTIQAIELYRRAIALEPSYVPPYLELESLLKGLGRIDECLELYRRAAELVPEQPVFRTRAHELRSFEAPSAESAVQSDPSGRANPAHIVVYADSSGISGAEQVNHAIALGLRTAGYRVTFVQPRASHRLIQDRIANGIPHMWIADDDIYRGGAASPSLCDPAEGQSLLREVHPDLVLFCDGCPVSNLGAKRAARDLGLPSIALVHCVTRDWASVFSRHLTTLGALYRSARQVISVSQDNLELLRECFGLPAERGMVIHNGVSSIFFESADRDIRSSIRKEHGIPDDAIVSLTVARMEPVKGYQFLIKAIRELRTRPAGSRLHFIWIGSGSMESRLRAMIDRIGATREIHLIGRTSRVQDYLDAADMFVLSSMFEGMPVSVMEAMARGLPVAATAVSGTPEELGTTGHLLPDPAVDEAGTIASLVDVLERWAVDESLRQEIGMECRRRAEKMFTRGRMIADYLHLVEGALGGGSATTGSEKALREVRP
jgi:glycosyltransferase involved in cell wall biosynthesis